MFLSYCFFIVIKVYCKDNSSGTLLGQRFKIQSFFILWNLYECFENTCPIFKTLPQSPVLLFVQSEIQGWDAHNRIILNNLII